MSANRAHRDRLEQAYGTRLRFLRVDFNSSAGQELAVRYQIRGHPTIVVIDRVGRARATIIGVPTRERVEQAIKDVMPKDERMLLPGPILKASPQPHDRTYQTLQHGRKVR